MIKYFCNKCGNEMKSPIMQITSVEEKKKIQKHYCEKCAAIIDAYTASISYGDKVEVSTSVKESTTPTPVNQEVSPTAKKEPTQHQKFTANIKDQCDKITEEFKQSGLVYNPDREANRVKWFDGENLKAVQFLIDRGASCSLISKMLDIPYVSVNSYFRKHGISTGMRAPISSDSVSNDEKKEDVNPDEDFTCEPIMRAGKMSFKSDENIKKIIKLRSLGFSVKEVAKKTKMPYNSAYNLILQIEQNDSKEDISTDEDGNIKKSVHKEKLVINDTIIDTSGILALYKAGWKVDAIASDKGYSVDTVKYVLMHKDKYMEV